MEVVNDVLREFDTFKGTSKAGKPYTVNLAIFEEFGTVSLGFNKPDALGLKAGEKIAIEVEKKFGKWEYVGTVDIDTPATMSTAPVAAPRAEGGGRGGYAPKPFPVPDTHGDMSIIHQNSLANALRFYELGVEYGDQDVPTKEQVIDLAYEFAAFSSGAHLAKLAKEK